MRKFIRSRREVQEKEGAWRAISGVDHGQADNNEAKSAASHSFAIKTARRPRSNFDTLSKVGSSVVRTSMRDLQSATLQGLDLCRAHTLSMDSLARAW
jgi:hypothetical protein